MIIKNVELETVCGITSKLPLNTRTEIAFAGKSNVGKSTLINGLVNRRSLARTSASPGKTQTINFYHVLTKETAAADESRPGIPALDFYMVDLPGYGYAKASEEIRQQWGKMIERYLQKSAQLRLVFLLVDIRHEPGENDRIMYDWICGNGFEPVIIATKLDKIKRSQQDRQFKILRQGLAVRPGTIIIPWSGQTKQGMDKIWDVIARTCMDGGEHE